MLKEVYTFLCSSQYTELSQVNEKVKESHPDAWPEDAMDQLTGVLGDLPWSVVGRFVQPRRLCVGDVAWSIDDLRSEWLGGLEI